MLPVLRCANKSRSRYFSTTVLSRGILDRDSSFCAGEKWNNKEQKFSVFVEELRMQHTNYEHSNTDTTLDAGWSANKNAISGARWCVSAGATLDDRWNFNVA